MASQPYVSGPSELYVYDGTNWNFLGYSESGARIQWIRHYDEFISDKSGSKMPADKQFMGLGAMISADLTVFRHDTLNLARRTIAGRTFGAIANGDMGQLVMYQGNDFRFCLHQPYANPALWGGQNKFPNMPEYLHFWHTTLVDDSETAGTKRKTVAVVFEATTYIDPCTGTGYFFDTNPGTLPTPC